MGTRSSDGHENPKRPRYLSTQSSGFSECSYSNEEEGTALANETYSSPSTKRSEIVVTEPSETPQFQTYDSFSATLNIDQSDLNTSSASRDPSNQSHPGNLAPTDDNNVSFYLRGSHVQGLETEDTHGTLNRCVASCKKKDGLKRISEELTA